MLYYAGVTLWVLGSAGFGVATIASEFDSSMRWPTWLVSASFPVTLAGVVLAGICH